MGLKAQYSPRATRLDQAEDPPGSICPGPRCTGRYFAGRVRWCGFGAVTARLAPAMGDRELAVNAGSRRPFLSGGCPLSSVCPQRLSARFFPAWAGADPARPSVSQGDSDNLVLFFPSHPVTPPIVSSQTTSGGGGEGMVTPRGTGTMRRNNGG